MSGSLKGQTGKGAVRHPGVILFETAMRPLGVSRNRLARAIDVPVGRISDIVNGKRGITPDTALRLAKFFGTTAELWMRLQIEYDLYVARRDSWREINRKIVTYSNSAHATCAANDDSIEVMRSSQKATPQINDPRGTAIALCIRSLQDCKSANTSSPSNNENYSRSEPITFRPKNETEIQESPGTTMLTEYESCSEHGDIRDTLDIPDPSNPPFK